MVDSDRHLSLKRGYDTGYTNEFVDKNDAKKQLKAGVKQLDKYQDVLYAQDIYSLLLMFQAMDAAGKDSTIKHVMSGINSQGCQVFSFKQPLAEVSLQTLFWLDNN